MEIVLACRRDANSQDVLEDSLLSGEPLPVPRCIVAGAQADTNPSAKAHITSPTRAGRPWNAQRSDIL